MYTVLLTPQKEIAFDTHSWYMFKVKEAVLAKAFKLMFATFIIIKGRCCHMLH